MTPIRKVGIIGAGQMGSGIAHVVALSGYDVTLNDMTKEKVDKALASHRAEHRAPGRLAARSPTRTTQAGARPHRLCRDYAGLRPTPIS